VIDCRPVTQSSQIVVRDLTKVFRKKQANGKYLTAVDHLSFGIPAGQCFGLLGVNGAGTGFSARHDFAY